jgi:prepilin signal peptidase PulO-like enzyme (type II secretory pathway)
MRRFLVAAMLAIVPVVAIILQAVKQTPIGGKLSAYMPFISMAIGVAAAFIAKMPNPVGAGVVIGLLASGSYSAFSGVSSISAKPEIKP